METLFAKHNKLIRQTSTKIVRFAMKEINWDARLICIQGSRGVGKSTLMKQFIKLHDEAYSGKWLYCSLDTVYFTTHSILELAEKFSLNGGQRLFLDEIHKYPSWSKEIKEIYDLYPELQVVFSGSSLLHILNADADLSRRCVHYEMQGLSFREFLLFRKGIEMPSYSLEEILANPFEICLSVTEKCKPVAEFAEYLKNGYYPFYFENKQDYYSYIEQVIGFVTEVELPLLCNVEIANVRKIQALLGILAITKTCEIDVSKLANAIGVHRNTVIEYLSYLNRAKILNLLYSDLKSVSKMKKPDKVYLENANLMYALANVPVNIGLLREIFVVNQLQYKHSVEYGKADGDFKVDGKYTFEVGGKEKNFKQIAGIENSFVLADDLEMPVGNKLPIWLVGLLY